MKRWLLRAMTLLVLLPGVVLPPGQPAEAAPTYFGRLQNYGYYDGVSHVDNTTVPPSTPSYNVFFQCAGTLHSGISLNWQTRTASGAFNINDFLNGVQERLFNNAPGIYRSCPASADRARASSLVNMMMGYNGNDPAFDLPGEVGSGPTRWGKGVAVAQANWPTFVKLIQAYDANNMAGGWGVRWNDLDTTVAGSNDYLGYDFGSEATPDEDGRFGHANTHEVHSIFLPGNRTNEPVIRFYNPNGTIFTILKICGNAIGNLAPLATSVLDASIQTWAGDQFGATVTAGGTYNLHALAINPGKLRSDSPAYLEVKVTSGSAAGPAFALGAGSAASPDPPLSDAQGYSPSAALLATGQAAQSRFFWRYPAAIPGGVTRTPPGGFSFMIPVGTPSGTQVCFTAFASPTLDGGYGGGPTRPNAVHCYTVLDPAYPRIEANNSDVHAGGGVCGQTLEPPLAGFIKMLPEADSVGQYAVSASSSINDFRSNRPGADTLRLGQNGNYTQVCRADLVKAAQIYTGATQPILGNDFDVTGESGVYIYNGAALTIHGTISNKLTVVALTGKVIVTAPAGLQLDTATHPSHDAPSLGVIAAGDIEINAGVTQVDAYLFSDGTIDTCKTGTGSCSNILTINGFVMAKQLSFGRLGPLNSHGQVSAERINMMPQIYLNPPALFDASVDETLLEGQGERPPLF